MTDTSPPTRGDQAAAPVGALEPERERIGHAIYMAKYGHQGAVWEANESKDVWFVAADAALAALAALAIPPSARGDHAAPDAWCVTEPDGSCVAEGPCIHSIPPVFPDALAPDGEVRP